MIFKEKVSETLETKVVNLINEYKDARLTKLNTNKIADIEPFRDISSYLSTGLVASFVMVHAYTPKINIDNNVDYAILGLAAVAGACAGISAAYKLYLDIKDNQKLKVGEKLPDKLEALGIDYNKELNDMIFYRNEPTEKVVKEILKNKNKNVV